MSDEVLSGIEVLAHEVGSVASRIGTEHSAGSGIGAPLDLAWIVLDTLRYDVACAELAAGTTPALDRLAGPAGWQRRHTPGTFTYPAHQAFFAGFLPTPATPGPHTRQFAAAFPGSASTTDETWVFTAETLPEALSRAGYETRCIGGVGFFNPATAIGCVFPSLFGSAHYAPDTSVTGRDPVRAAAAVLREWDEDPAAAAGAAPRFTYVNVAALHQPNHWYLDGIDSTPDARPADTLASHAAALRYVDGALPELLGTLVRPGRELALWLFSDHGTCYGEEGFHGHRNAHDVVTTVPYLEARLQRKGPQ